MVERTYRLDNIFKSLSDSTRRDILKRIAKHSSSVGEIAKHYELSFAGVAKHVEMLQRAGLVSKTRNGKEQIVTIVPKNLAAANDYLETYRTLWERRLDSLDTYLKSINK